MNAILRNQLEASLALTDAPRLPPRKWSFESWREYRARCRRMEIAEAERNNDLLRRYHEARNEWAVWFAASRGWPGLNADQQDEMEGAFERAVELRNAIYGTEY